MTTVKPGDMLYTKRYNIWTYRNDWNFSTVKHITKGGNIRLENGELVKAQDLDKFWHVFDTKVEEEYTRDCLTQSAINLLTSFGNLLDHNRNVRNNVSSDSLIGLCQFVKKLGIQNMNIEGDNRAYKDFMYGLNRFDYFCNRQEELDRKNAKRIGSNKK